jgi:type VI secretion system protein ImpC
MPQPVSFGQIAVNLTAGAGAGAGPARPDAPFRILVLGDLSGRTGREGSLGLAGRPVRVDRDNLDEVLAKVGPALRLPDAGAGGNPITIPFAELDDFHPDRLYQRVDWFERLRQLRRRLQDPATSAAAAEEVRGWRAAAAEAPRPTPAADDTPPPPEAAGLNLEELLGVSLEETRRRHAAGPGGDQTDWNAFIQHLVEPHVRAVPAADPQQAELVACVDEAAAGLLRALLHAPGFQALESAWRGIDFLTRRLDTDSNLSVHLLDVSKPELAADLAAGDDLGRTGLAKLLIEKTLGTPGGEPWAVVVGCYTFGPAAADAELLGRLAKVAAGAGCAFVAAAGPGLVRGDSFAGSPDPDDWQRPADPDGAAAWEALRQLPEAAHVGLALPRFLLRRPYGQRSDPVSAFAFEELGEPPDHEGYLWGNPALACAYLLGEAFSRSGWALRPGEVSEIDGLPGHVYREEGEARLKPCAEAELTERAARVIGEAGLMPLLSVRGQDAVRLASFRPLARTAATLAGRWR